MRLRGDDDLIGRDRMPSGAYWDGWLLFDDVTGQEIQVAKPWKSPCGITCPVPLQLSG